MVESSKGGSFYPSSLVNTLKMLLQVEQLVGGIQCGFIPGLGVLCVYFLVDEYIAVILQLQGPEESSSKPVAKHFLL